MTTARHRKAERFLCCAQHRRLRSFACRSSNSRRRRYSALPFLKRQLRTAQHLFSPISITLCLPFEERPLVLDILFGSLAHNPRQRHFFFFGDDFESLVNLRREADRRSDGRRALTPHLFPSPFWP